MPAFRHTSSNSCMLEWTDLGFEEVLCDKKFKKGEGDGEIYILISSSSLVITR